MMRIGTKSVLFGVHQFLLHPMFVAIAWWKLYGFPWDPRLWVAFFVHDLGYWGKPNMDGPEGELHPLFGAKIMHRLFDTIDLDTNIFRWMHFCMYHSRTIAQRDAMPISKLCVADKFAWVLMPWWIFIPLGWLTGELDEYMEMGRREAAAGNNTYLSTVGALTRSTRKWHADFQCHLRQWVDNQQRGWLLRKLPVVQHTAEGCPTATCCIDGTADIQNVEGAETSDSPR